MSLLITPSQPIDGDLTAIAALVGTTGLLKKTAADTWMLDTTAYSTTTGTVTSVAALTIGTTGTDITSTVANGSTTAVITLNIPTASASNRGALSSADWTTFNNKQPAGSYLTAEADTLTTVTGRGASTSTASTFSGGLSVTGLTVSKSGTDSLITFPAQTNDPGYIKHYENANSAAMQFSVSDDNGNTDYFGFGSSAALDTFKIWSNGTVAAGTWNGSSISTTYTDAKVTSVSGTAPISVSPTTGAVGITHDTSGVGAGTYNNVTVNTYGHVTGGSNVAYLTSYSESDTLATVTARGASTSTLSTFSGGLIASAGIYGAASGAPDVAIWMVSPANPTWGIFYNEGTPDAIEFKGAGVVTCSIALDNGNIVTSGSLSAASKSFLIDHPTKEGMKLQYGSLESPYHGVRLTGEAVIYGDSVTVNLPDYIHGLCRQEGSQVQITNIRHGKVLWVESIDVDNDNFVIGMDRQMSDSKEYKFYWSFTGVRKDIEDIIVEF